MRTSSCFVADCDATCFATRICKNIVPCITRFPPPMVIARILISNLSVAHLQTGSWTTRKSANGQRDGPHNNRPRGQRSQMRHNRAALLAQPLPKTPAWRDTGCDTPQNARINADRLGSGSTGGPTFTHRSTSSCGDAAVSAAQASRATPRHPASVTASVVIGRPKTSAFSSTARDSLPRRRWRVVAAREDANGRSQNAWIDLHDVRVVVAQDVIVGVNSGHVAVDDDRVEVKVSQTADGRQLVIVRESAGVVLTAGVVVVGEVGTAGSRTVTPLPPRRRRAGRGRGRPGY